MIRINIVVEGHSEEQFVRDILGEYLAEKGIYIYARRVKTGRKSGKDYRGGVTTYAKIKNDVLRWLAEDNTAYLSTFFDLYRLPNDFPQFKEAQKQQALQRVNCLETAFKNDIKHDKFIPYIQLYEFEGLLFSDVQAIDECITLTLDAPSQLKKLHQIRSQYPTPEHINDGANTAPSKRLGSLYPYYDKVLHGSLISEEIGLKKLRQECSHFDQWVSRLEKLVDL
jgi:hypothetical protein